MDVMNVRKTLFPRVVNAVVPALQLKPDERSGFENGALAAAEGCFTNFLREKEDTLNTLSRGTAAARERLHRTKADVGQTRLRIEAGSKALRETREDQKERENAFREAERCRKEHKEHVALLSKSAKAQARALADLGQMRKAFTSLANGP